MSKRLRDFSKEFHEAMKGTKQEKQYTGLFDEAMAQLPEVQIQKLQDALLKFEKHVNKLAEGFRGAVTEINLNRREINRLKKKIGKLEGEE